MKCVALPVDVSVLAFFQVNARGVGDAKHWYVFDYNPSQKLYELSLVNEYDDSRTSRKLPRAAISRGEAPV